MAASLEAIRHTHTYAVIDGNSLMHRAFHAVPSTMNAPDGRATNACFGFISMLIKLIEEFRPNGIICAFDAGVPEFRKEALSQYKAQRPATDPLLKEQFPIIEQLLKSMAIPVVRIKGWEGDDILGTLAAHGEEEGKRILLVTGDKDAYQLASETTSIVTTKKGISDVVVYDPDEVFDRYGITPAQVPDFLGLKGDPSDNIPGVPGIGEKTAAKLLQEYGTLEEIIAHADKLKGKMGESLRANVQGALDSRKVATIVRDVPLELDLDEVSFPSFDPVEVKEAFGEVRFNHHMAKVLAIGSTATSASMSTEGSAVTFTGDAGSGAAAVIAPLFMDDAAVHMLESAIRAEEWLGLIVGTGDGSSLFGDSRELFVASSQGVACFKEGDVAAALSHVLETGKVIALDSKTLIQQLIPPDTTCAVACSPEDLDASRIFDCSIAAYLLDSARTSYDLKSLLEDFCFYSLPELDDEQQGGAVAAGCLRALMPVLHQKLKEDGSLKCFQTIEMPLVAVLVAMERVGVDLDVAVLEELGKSTEAAIEELKTSIFRLAGEEFNIDSPKQLGVVLFEKLKLPGKKKTKTGYSTDASVLTELAGSHPLPQAVIEYRELAKIKSTYIDALPRLIATDRRLHTTFNQTVTATGRLSSSNPNLQNIPVRTEFGRHIREAFKPAEEDMVFVSADYSQIELRLLAHLSRDQGLIDAFTGGRDFHAATAARVFGVEPDAVDAGMRSRAKAVNFGIVYGQQAFGLARSLGIGFKEAQSMIDRYFDAYPRVREYLDETVAQARRSGYAITMFGRKRHIREINSHNANLKGFGERTAMNHPMQGSAADIIKLAMIEVARRMRDEDYGARLCLQVHDELVFECPRTTAQQLGAMVQDVMSGIVKLAVPLEVGLAIGDTWAQAK